MITITGATMNPSRLLASTRYSENSVPMMASNAIQPSTAPYHMRHRPMAQAPMSAVKMTMPPAAGCLPPILSPAIQAMKLASPSPAASSAEIRMTIGRSPGASGLRLARASASRRWLRVSSSPVGTAHPPGRLGLAAGAVFVAVALSATEAVLAAGAGLAALVGADLAGPRRPRLRLRCANACLAAQTERARRRLGIGRVGDRAHHGDPGRARRAHRRHIAGVDPADGKERRGGMSGRVAHQLQADGGATG